MGPVRNGDRDRIRGYGERLLLRDPRDYYVLYYMVDYSPEKNALVYAKRMVEIEPQKLSAIASLAFVQFRMFLATHTQRDADAAILAYEKLEKRLDVNDKAGRQDARRTIEHIRRVRARWRSRVKG